MKSVSVQLGVLAVARDQARPPTQDIDTVVTRATAAGHRIVAQRTVGDLQGPIRDWLRRWIDDKAIDCVIVLGRDSTTTADALQPLVTQPVPGFSDLFRWLMLQESGASAMLPTAEAARCGGTFVFVVPGAVGAVMDKLILPQFDSRTTPNSLVAQMPRLAGLIEIPPADAVPVKVPPERTQGGPGLPARLPARPAPRVATGANVITRGHPVEDDDPPTREMDLANLEQHLAAASGRSTSDVTRQTDLSRSDDLDDTIDDKTVEIDLEADAPTLTTTSAAPAASASGPSGPRRMLEAEPRLAEPPAPGRSPARRPISTPPATPVTPAPSTGVGPARLGSQLGARPPTAPPPVARPITRPPPPPPSQVIERAIEMIEMIEPERELPPPARPARPVTAPPPALTVSAVRAEVRAEVRADMPLDALPQGAFTYRKPARRLHPAVKIIGAVAVVALGFVGGIMILDRSNSPAVAAAPPAGPEDAGSTAPALDEPVVAVPVPPEDIELPPDVLGRVPSAAPRPPAGTRPRTRTGPVTAPVAGPVTTPGPVTPPGTTPVAAPAKPPPAPPETTDGATATATPTSDCDEAACVLSNYDQPCCAAFKPSPSALGRRVGGVPASLDRAMVRAGIDTIKPRVVGCGETSGVTGTVKIGVTVTPEGAVSGTEVKDTPDAALGTCVATALRNAKFGTSINGGTFTYPFVF